MSRSKLATLLVASALLLACAVATPAPPNNECLDAARRLLDYVELICPSPRSAGPDECRLWHPFSADVTEQHLAALAGACG